MTNRFDNEDMKIIDKLKLIRPSELINVDDLAKYQEDVKKVQKQIPYEIGGLKKKERTKMVSKQKSKKKKEKKKQ